MCVWHTIFHLSADLEEEEPPKKKQKKLSKGEKAMELFYDISERVRGEECEMEEKRRKQDKEHDMTYSEC